MKYRSTAESSRQRGRCSPTTHSDRDAQALLRWQKKPLLSPLLGQLYWLPLSMPCEQPFRTATSSLKSLRRPPRARGMSRRQTKQAHFDLSQIRVQQPRKKVSPSSLHTEHSASIQLVGCEGDSLRDRQHNPTLAAFHTPFPQTARGGPQVRCADAKLPHWILDRRTQHLQLCSLSTSLQSGIFYGKHRNRSIICAAKQEVLRRSTRRSCCLADLAEAPNARQQDQMA